MAALICGICRRAPTRLRLGTKNWERRPRRSLSVRTTPRQSILFSSQSLDRNATVVPGLGHDEERTEPVKRISMYVFTIVLTFALTAMLARVAAHHSHFVGRTVRNPTDAASRDGLFQGRLDAERGRKQHLASGRWNTDADRRSFVSAYLQAYRELGGRAVSEGLGSWQLAEQIGYHDGIADGLQQRQGPKPFQANATENYRRADRGYSESSVDLNQYKRAYREAYGNGYQQGYYGEPERI